MDSSEPGQSDMPRSETASAGMKRKLDVEKFTRGSKISAKGVTDKKARTLIKKQEKKFRDAAMRAAKAEVLKTEDYGYLEADENERTVRFSQKQLHEHVDENTRQKMFSLNLPELGPYKMKYTRNGRHALLGGLMGHLAAFDWHQSELSFELQLRETLRDVTWLHDHTMLATAQRKHVYIYDSSGIEIHCLRNHIEVNKLDFLPYHFLLVSIGNAGVIKFQDTSTGDLVAEHKTKLGRCSVMRQNPHNAVMLTGHNNGVVNMWSPSMSTPLVRMLTHKGALTSLAIDNTGNYLVTSGVDKQMTIWDVRTFKPMHSYILKRPATDVDISQRGLLSVGFGTHVEVWKDALQTKVKEPYMSHHFSDGTHVSGIRFCPFEDVLGVGHSKGVDSIVIPGSGEANFDAMEANPFETNKQRREVEIRSLLEKLKPEMIGLNDFIATADRAPAEVIAEERRLAKEANSARKPIKEKKHMRGRDKSSKRAAKKQEEHFKASQKKAKKLEREAAAAKQLKSTEDTNQETVLDRFRRGG